MSASDGVYRHKFTVRDDGTINIKVADLLEMSGKVLTVQAKKKRGAGRKSVVLIESGGTGSGSV